MHRQVARFSARCVADLYPTRARFTLVHHPGFLRSPCLLAGELSTGLATTTVLGSSARSSVPKGKVTVRAALHGIYLRQRNWRLCLTDPGPGREGCSESRFGGKVRFHPGREVRGSGREGSSKSCSIWGRIFGDNSSGKYRSPPRS